MSATHDSFAPAVAVANQAAVPNHFFSLPGELRDQIYDILHQHEESTRFHSLTFRYPAPLSHLRLINRQFTAEFGNASRLVITQTSRNQICYPSAQPLCLPEILSRRIFGELEVNFDVCDTYHEPISQLMWFKTYSDWLWNLCLLPDTKVPQLVSPTSGGKLHLRLFFNYISNLERLQNEISSRGWYDFCTKISLVYDGDKLSRAQTVATRSRGSGWETDERFIKQGYAEWAIGRLQADQVAVSESV